MGFLAAALVFFIALLSACDPAPSAPAAPGDAVRGAEFYQKYCFVCHQADGTGRPKGADRPIAANFGGPDSVLSKSDEELLRVIRVGTTGKIGAMPGWAGLLSAQDRRDVLAYIRKTFGRAP